MKRIHSIILGIVLLFASGLYAKWTKDMTTSAAAAGFALFLLGLSRQHPEDKREIRRLKSAVPTQVDDKSSGATTTKLMVVVLGLLLPQLAQAAEMPTPPLGGCFGMTKQTCAGLVIPEGISGLRLTNPDAGALVAGAFPAGGVGYALHFWWSEWHTVSLALAVAASSGTSGAQTSANIAGLLGFAKYVFLGTMVRIEPGVRDWYGLASFDVLALVTEPATRAARQQRIQ